jgi:fucose permease
VETSRARTAVGVVFVLNGLLYASLLARVPDLRDGLDLGNGPLGLLLLAIAGGSLLALPSSGWLIERHGAARVVRAGAVLVAVGLTVAAVSTAPLGSVAGTAVGLFVYGVGSGVWDVAMNVEAAEVERRVGRTMMPRFHAGFSLGTMGGAGLGVLVAAADAPMLAHLATLSVVGLVAAVVASGSFLPVTVREVPEQAPVSAWGESRTLLIGLMVLTFAVAEGTANDWISLAVIDGYAAREWVGVASFAVFVTAMTAGRLLGPPFLDRYGRARVLWACVVAVAVGVALTVWGAHPVPVAVGIVVWGLGASLGFPVGMSAAASDPARAAARVSVVSTIGYGAFLGGPPLVGWVGDRVGTLDSLLVVLALMVVAAPAVLAAREPEPDRAERGPG